jgi:mannose-6-phosphate isomerase-like protein (cupin superfamily)
MIPTLTRVTARSVTEDYPSFPQSDVEVFLTVLSGRMALHSKVYETLELGEGDCVYYDASAGHAWTSIGDDDAVVIWVMSS